jgi:uncharacterized protein
MSAFFKYFQRSVFVTAIALVFGYLLNGIQGVFTVALLGVLEVSLSLDNAVVNEKKLRVMSERGRKWFLLWGWLIAVVGMRLVIPMIIVASIGGLGPVEVTTLAIRHPDQYAVLLAASHLQVAAFGGAFLLMVFLNFMCDAEKDSHWIGWLEAPLAKVGKLDMIQSVVTLAVVLIASLGLPSAARVGFVTAGVVGWIAYALVEGLSGLLEEYDEAKGTNTKQALTQTLRAAIPGLLYLEVLDASMSFDGVMGAFGLSDNIFLIMAGLGVGAMFVRSMTIMLVEAGTLATFRYLENGAFWAIGALAAIMMLSVKMNVPDVVTGLIGAAMIGAALWSSIRANRLGPPADDEDGKEEANTDIAIDGQVSVSDLAQRLNVQVSDVVKALMKYGVTASATQTIDATEARMAAEDLGFQPVFRRRLEAEAAVVG